MSLFRAPQVPQQPPKYFTPGQPLGIPRPRVDMQMQQLAAYYRQRPDNEAAQLAALESRDLRTAGTSIGIPNPVQCDQTQATWRSHIDIPLPPPANKATLSGAAIQNVPPTPLQVPFTARLPIEWIVVENYAPAFTPGQPLGIPQPRQPDQAQATWRARIEIQQPQVFTPQLSPVVFVPAPDLFGFDSTSDEPPQKLQNYVVQSAAAAAVQVPSQPLQSLPSVRWPLEWIVENYSIEFTPGALAVTVQIPVQTDQAQATWRQRQEIQQPAIRRVPIQAIAYIPQSVLPRIASVRALQQWIQPQIAAFFSVGVPFFTPRIIVKPEDLRTLTVDANRTIKLS